MVSVLILLTLAASPAVVIVDNVLFYGSDHKMRILNTGDMVDIVEHINDRLTVEYDSATGEMDKNVLIDFNDEIAEDEQFVFSRGYFDEGEFEKASRLLEIFVRYFDTSNYLAEALYYLGQSYEAMATKSDSDSLSVFFMNTQLNQRYYNGDAYRILLKEFPESPFAAKAQYRLINIFRISNLPWRDSAEPIEEEIAMWDDFCDRYRFTDEYVLGLSELGYLNRILFEITDEPAYREAATSKFEEITFEYPNTIHSAYARVHLFELKNNEKIYKY
jgi:outer membrane protein assembly factor BamD (BamD/ComL family)